MTSTEHEPTHEQLLAMAYADGELAGPERAAFERTLAAREDLRAEVARLRRLDVLARHAAGPEPMDHEWRALARDPLQRAGLGLGWTLLIAGTLALAGFGMYELWSGAAPTLLKCGVSAVALGLALLLALAARARLRTRPHDPYTEIDR